LADPAVRARMSAATKAALADPAVRARMSAAKKAAWADPAVRARMSAATAWAVKQIHGASMLGACLRAQGLAGAAEGIAGAAQGIPARPGDSLDWTGAP
jgi:hypothetical protein